MKVVSSWSEPQVNCIFNPPFKPLSYNIFIAIDVASLKKRRRWKLFCVLLREKAELFYQGLKSVSTSKRRLNLCCTFLEPSKICINWLRKREITLLQLAKICTALIVICRTLNFHIARSKRLRILKRYATKYIRWLWQPFKNIYYSWLWFLSHF